MTSNVSKNLQQALKLFFEAAAGGDSAAVAQFLDKNSGGINEKDDSGQTALMQAATYGHKDVVALLLERGAAVNEGSVGRDTQDISAWTALMYAAHAGHKQVVELLLEKGADPALTDEANYGAGDYAEAEGHDDIAVMVREWPEIKKRRAEEQKRQEAEAELKDFSPALKRDMPAGRPLKVPGRGR